MHFHFFLTYVLSFWLSVFNSLQFTLLSYNFPLKKKLFMLINIEASQFLYIFWFLSLFRYLSCLFRSILKLPFTSKTYISFSIKSFLLLFYLIFIWLFVNPLLTFSTLTLVFFANILLIVYLHFIPYSFIVFFNVFPFYLYIFFIFFLFYIYYLI